MSKKYVGYGIGTERSGVKSITIVPAKTKTEAIETFESLDIAVISEEHIHRVCLVKYPGPLSVKLLKVANWDKIKLIEDKDNEDM